MDLKLCLLLHCPLPSGALRTKLMMRKMQEVAQVQPEDKMMSSPSGAGTLWVPVVVLVAPADEAGWQWDPGLSDSPVAVEHLAERWG